MMDRENVARRRLVAEIDEERRWRREIGLGREGELSLTVLSTSFAASYAPSLVPGTTI